MTGTLRREVDITPLREAFQRSGLTPAQVAIRLGWLDRRGYGDTMRVQRILGIKPWKGWKPRGTHDFYQRSTNYELATSIAEAIGVDPVDVGL